MSKVRANPPPVNQPSGPWVYFIQDGINGPIKIGTTNKTPEARLAGLSTGNVRALRLLVAIPGDKNVEAAHHVTFQGVRIRGEWFHPSSRLLAYIDDHRRNNPLAMVGEEQRSREAAETRATLDRIQEQDAEIARLVARIDELEAASFRCASPVEGILPLAKVIENASRAAIIGALYSSGGSRERAAKLLNVSPTTLWRKMTALSISDADIRGQGAPADEENEETMIDTPQAPCPAIEETKPVSFSGKSRSENLADLKAATRARLGR